MCCTLLCTTLHLQIVKSSVEEAKPVAQRAAQEEGIYSLLVLQHIVLTHSVPQIETLYWHNATQVEEEHSLSGA